MTADTTMSTHYTDFLWDKKNNILIYQKRIHGQPPEYVLVKGKSKDVVFGRSFKGKGKEVTYAPTPPYNYLHDLSLSITFESFST